MSIAVLSMWVMASARRGSRGRRAAGIDEVPDLVAEECGVGEEDLLVEPEDDQARERLDVTAPGDVAEADVLVRLLAAERPSTATSGRNVR